MFIGLLFTLLIPETKGRSLEEISENAHEVQHKKVTEFD